MAIVIARSVIVYFTLTLVMRIMGKRQLGEMELTEFVLAALIADMAAHPLQDIGIPMINGLVPILVLFCCEILISGITLRKPKLRALLFGKPSMLIRRGKLDQTELKNNRLTVDELMQELRSQSYTDISKIAYAVLETNGKLSIIPFPAHLPPTSQSLGVAADDAGYPRVVICDGRVFSHNLKSVGLDESWLKKQLKAHGASSPENVFLMTVDESGRVYYAKKERD